jgi:glycosyltransferase involved in cell wall biosynthesis
MHRSVRILYPLLWSRPGRQACQAQSIATAAALARLGHEVVLVMPQGASDPDLAPRDLRDWFGVEGDFQVLQRRSRWSGTRLHRTLLWMRQVIGERETREADLIYSRIPAMFAFGDLSPIPFATDHYRPWPDVLPASRPFIRRTARAANCLGLILHSHYAAGAYRRAGVPEQRLLVAHNGFDQPGERLDKAEARARLGLPADRRIATYAGRINPAKGLASLIALADRRPETLFLLVGSEGEGAIERECRSRANIRVVPWVEPAALAPWLFAADVLVIPPSLVPLKRSGTSALPIKLFAYLAAGRPILAPEAPDTAELLKHGETAWIVAPDNPGLGRLLSDGALAALLATNASRMSEQFTWDSRGEKIAAFLQARIAQRSL